VEPEGGLQTTGSVEQLPLLVGNEYVTVAQGLPEQVVFAVWVILAGHVIVQVEEPMTVTLKLQIASTLLDSVAVQLT
jgi:hypothetical protein